MGETLCEHTIRHQDVRFRKSDFDTGKKAWLRFYAGAPLTTSQGHTIGTLCLMSTQPMEGLDETQIKLFRQMADAVTHKMEQRLCNAVRHEEFELAYQPIVDLQQANRTVGAEALIRWRQSDGSYIRPDMFIPLAEELRLIHPIGLWDFEVACGALKRWRDLSGEPFWVSVNLSPLQLRDRQLLQRLAAIDRQAGVSPRDVKLEIAESALIEEFERVAGLIDELIEIGFPLALDDFGTGQSSLSRLIHLPFSVLKVDRAFVKDSPDGHGAAVVASLAGLARSLKLDAVGERIETQAHEAYLKSQGYQLGQGYLYSKPLPEKAFIRHLKSEYGITRSRVFRRMITNRVTTHWERFRSGPDVRVQ